MEAHRGGFERTGVKVQFIRSNPPNSTRPEKGQSLRFEAEGQIVDFLLWDSGECEVLSGETPAAVTVTQHRVLSEADLSELARRLFPDALASLDENSVADD